METTQPLTATPDSLRVAIMSDLHVFDKTRPTYKDTQPSFLEISASESPTGQHPIAALRTLIAKDQIKADILLCPGDLSDKACPASAKFAWSAIHSIGSALSVKEIVATAGNHDVDSRYAYNEYDAKGVLQTLSPLFPVNQEAAFDRYWSRHFVCLAWPKVRLIVLNSSAYHGSSGTGSPSLPEYAHGRISAHTLASISTLLNASPQSSHSERINILLCHHHPIPMEEHGLGASDVMAGGADLITMLGTGKLGEWFIVHGHKHFPKLCYASGASVSPVVLAAGSLCARLHPDISAVARNQFYIIEFPLALLSSFGLVGRFTAWDWIYGIGWQAAQKSSGLPHKGGFGYREKSAIVASQIVDECISKQTTWETVRNRIPRIDFLHPNDLDLVIDALQSDHNLQVLLNTDGQIAQIDRLS